jgi:hypothetical protein
MPGPLDGILSGANANDVARATGADRGSQAAHTAELVRSILSLPDDVAVTVQQLTCREPGCPPVETVIAVLGAPPRRWTLHHPLTAISDEMVTRLLIDDSDGGPHDNS